MFKQLAALTLGLISATTASAQTEGNPVPEGLTIFFGDRVLMISSNDTYSMDQGNLVGGNSTLPASLQNISFTSNYGQIFGRQHGSVFGLCDSSGFNVTPYQSLFTTTNTNGVVCSDLPEGVFHSFGPVAARLSTMRQNVIDLCQPTGDILPESASSGLDSTYGLWWEVANSNPTPTNYGGQLKAQLFACLDAHNLSGSFFNGVVLNGFGVSLWNDANTGVEPTDPVVRLAMTNNAVDVTLLVADTLKVWCQEWATLNGVTIDDSKAEIIPVRRPRWDAATFFPTLPQWPNLASFQQRYYDNEWFNSAVSDQWDVRAVADPLMGHTIDLNQLLIDEGATNCYPTLPNNQYLYTPCLNDQGVWLLGKEFAGRMF